MNCCSTIPFEQLPFSKLFNDYIKKTNSLSQFFETHPFSKEQRDSYLDYYNFRGNRETSVELLKSFNKQFDATDQTLQQIEKLRDENSMAVVTGQQLTLYGGPLFTVYKIASAIIQARDLQNEYERSVIPVFWLADEDHDYEEAATIGILDRDDWHSVSYQLNGKNESPVGRLELDDSFKKFRENIRDFLFETDFTRELTNLLDTCYRPGSTFRESFGTLVLKLFGKHGLILAGSDDPGIKELGIEILTKSVSLKNDVYQSVLDTSEALINKGYHRQVEPGKSNLFWIDGSGNRLKLKTGENGVWNADGKNSWSEDELIREIENIPERFSPNVFTRPLLQDILLPVVSYVAGPGELAYYAQMKDFYTLFGMKMPMILPRFSATLLESNIDRIMEKLPFKIGEYDQRIEDLESQYMEGTDEVDIEKIFREWKKKVDKITEKKKTEIDQVDPTLKGSAGKVTALYFTELDKLKGKLYRSQKEQEQTNLNRIRKIKANLFPGGGLQERNVAFIYFMNKYGLDIWDKTISFLTDEEPVNHKVIRL